MSQTDICHQLWVADVGQLTPTVTAFAVPIGLLVQVAHVIGCALQMSGAGACVCVRAWLWASVWQRLLDLHRNSYL